MCMMLRYNHTKRDSNNTEAGELRRTGRGRIGYSLYTLSDSVDILNRKKKRLGQRTTADRGKNHQTKQTNRRHLHYSRPAPQMKGETEK